MCFANIPYFCKGKDFLLIVFYCEALSYCNKSILTHLLDME